MTLCWAVQCLFLLLLHCPLDDWCSTINLYLFLQETLRNNWLHQYKQNMFINPTKKMKSYVETIIKHWGKDRWCNFNVFIIKYTWFLTSFLWFTTLQQWISVPMNAYQYYTLSAPPLPIPATATAATTMTRYHGPWCLWSLPFWLEPCCCMGAHYSHWLVVLDPRNNTQSSCFQSLAWNSKKNDHPVPSNNTKWCQAWMPVMGTTMATATNDITSYNNQPWDCNINLVATVVVTVAFQWMGRATAIGKEKINLCSPHYCSQYCFHCCHCVIIVALLSLLSHPFCFCCNLSVIAIVTSIASALLHRHLHCQYCHPCCIITIAIIAWLFHHCQVNAAVNVTFVVLDAVCHPCYCCFWLLLLLLLVIPTHFLLLIGNKIEQLLLKLSQKSHLYFKHNFKKTFWLFKPIKLVEYLATGCYDEYAHIKCHEVNPLFIIDWWKDEQSLIKRGSSLWQASWQRWLAISFLSFCKNYRNGFKLVVDCHFSFQYWLQLGTTGFWGVHSL